MRTITVTEKYRAVNEGRMSKTEFVRQMRQSYPMYISPVGTYDSTVQILKNKNMLFEEKEYEVDDTFKYSDDSLRRAIDIELEAMGLMSHGTVSMDDQVKAKKKAIANLKKDPLHYYNLISGDSSKVNKHDKPVEVKKGNEVDTFNGMKKATLKEAKQNLKEGTRALVGFLSGDRLTTTYNHYDGYPSGLGKGLMTHYNNDDLAKDIAMKGYITGMDPDTGEISQTHQDPPKKIVLDDDAEERAKEIAEEIDSMGADYGYIWDDQSNQWVTIKNTGIRSMIDQMMDKLSMMNVYSGDKMNEVPAEEAVNEGMDLEEFEREYLSTEFGSSLADDYSNTKKYTIQSLFDSFKELRKKKNYDFEEFFELVDNGKIKRHSASKLLKMKAEENIAEPTLKETLGGIVAFLKSKGAKNDSIKDFIKTHKDDIQGMSMDDVEDEYNNFLSVNTDYVDESEVAEKKGKDHDGDGDIDSDDYLAAKDKAIKKAMGKEVNESVVKKNIKSIITKVLEEEVINEAATNDLAKIADEYEDFGGLKPAVISLQNIVTEIESFYDKTREKIQKVYDALGNVTNDEGLKVGAFITPSIENAFKRDLKHIIKNQFTGGLNMPQVRRISQNDIDRGTVQQEAPKDTVFSPVNEKKNKNGK